MPRLNLAYKFCPEVTSTNLCELASEVTQSFLNHLKMKAVEVLVLIIFLQQLPCTFSTPELCSWNSVPGLLGNPTVLRSLCGLGGMAYAAPASPKPRGGG